MAVDDVVFTMRQNDNWGPDMPDTDVRKGQEDGWETGQYCIKQDLPHRFNGDALNKAVKFFLSACFRIRSTFYGDRYISVNIGQANIYLNLSMPHRSLQTVSGAQGWLPLDLHIRLAGMIKCHKGSLRVFCNLKKGEQRIALGHEENIVFPSPAAAGAKRKIVDTQEKQPAKRIGVNHNGTQLRDVVVKHTAVQVGRAPTSIASTQTGLATCNAATQTEGSVNDAFAACGASARRIVELNTVVAQYQGARENLTDSITLDPLKNDVVVLNRTLYNAGGGPESIRTWVQEHNTDPMTNAPASVEEIKPLPFLSHYLGALPPFQDTSLVPVGNIKQQAEKVVRERTKALTMQRIAAEQQRDAAEQQKVAAESEAKRIQKEMSVWAQKFENKQQEQIVLQNALDKKKQKIKALKEAGNQYVARCQSSEKELSAKIQEVEQQRMAYWRLNDELDKYKERKKAAIAALNGE